MTTNFQSPQLHKRMKDRIGHRFARLTVVALADIVKKKRECIVYWECICECGQNTVVDGKKLVRGHTRSCGCLLTEFNRTNVKHGNTAGGKISPEYNSWSGMMARCYQTSNPSYPQWGGRGIRVCSRWHDASVFLADMGPKPSKDHSIDRVDNDRDYSPDNCRWATRSQQNKNRRPFGSAKHASG